MSEMVSFWFFLVDGTPDHGDYPILSLCKNVKLDEYNQGVSGKLLISLVMSVKALKYSPQKGLLGVIF
jgi:hypothetical protein